MSDLYQIIQQWVSLHGGSDLLAGIAARSTVILLTVVLSLLANFVAKRLIVGGLRRLAAKTKSKWDDLLLRRKVFTKLSHLVPGLVIFLLAADVLAGHPQWIATVMTATQIYMVLVGFAVGNALLSAVVDIYRTLDISRIYPIKGFVQVVKILIFVLTAIFVLSIVLKKSPAVLVGGLGALTAIAMLVFKDSILGLVAGVHLSANRMLARGDWVELPAYNADGEVLDVSLASVQIQNWDKTITTIPTYALISESFKNWRGMAESGGRRIKRAIHLDINTITFCNQEMLDRFAKIAHISEYLQKKREELRTFNAEHGLDQSTLANGRHLTNVGTFRAYVKAYLEDHPMVNQQMTLLVRQMQPTERGLPIEIYAFCKDKRWANYEAVMADIFDHIFAVVREFDLRVFQAPGGRDFEAALRKAK